MKCFYGFFISKETQTHFCEFLHISHLYFWTVSMEDLASLDLIVQMRYVPSQEPV
jgi:hypothetical protein